MKKGKPMVSVVIPVYNGEKTLKQCLDSLLKQTFKSYEIIIVNNNSTDATPLILADYRKKSSVPFKIVFEGQRGRGIARNLGVMQAGGKIVVSGDADCIFPEEWIKDITAPIRNEGEVAVLGGERPAMYNFWTGQYQRNSNRFREANRIKKRYINHIDTKNFAILREVLLKFKTKQGIFHKSLYTDDFELATRFLSKGYKVRLLQRCKVKHYHFDSFFRTIRLEICRAYDCTKVYLKLKATNSFMPKTTVLECCKQLDERDFIHFFEPFTSCFLKCAKCICLSFLKPIRKGRKKHNYIYKVIQSVYSELMEFDYNLISLSSWRLGVLLAFIDGKKLQ